MRRWVSWEAVSSKPQMDGESMADQHRDNVAIAAQLGGEVVAVLQVPGYSREYNSLEAIRGEVSAYAELERIIRQRGADVLVFRDWDRLGRTPALILQVAQECWAAGIALYNRAMPPQSLDPGRQRFDIGNLLMASFGAWRSGAEMATLRERHRAGMITRTKRGQFPKVPIWGWLYVYDAQGNRSIHIDEEAARIIRYVFLECLVKRGWSYQRIAEDLNQRGWTRNDTPWESGNVHGLSKYIRQYAGIAVLNERSRTGRPVIEAPAAWPAIFTEAEMRSIQDEIAGRAPSGRRHVSGRLFSRVARCDECGAWLTVNAVHRSAITGEEMVRYRCGRHGIAEKGGQRGKPCRGSHIAETKLLTAIRKRVVWLAQPENRAATLSHLPSRTNQILHYIEQTEAEIAEMETKRARLVRAYVDLGAISEGEFREQSERLHEQAERLRNQLENLHGDRVKAADDDRMGDRLAEIADQGMTMLAAETQEANAWLRRHFVVYVRDNDVFAIEYR